MGGVHITNRTAIPLKVQLWQVSCLYHDHIAPGETFSRNTGAVYFTIYVEAAERDDTDWTQTVLPIVTFGAEVVKILMSKAFSSLPELVNNSVAQGDTSHYVCSSPGWYFGGENFLEVRGGAKFVNSTYGGTALKIVDKNDSSRHS